LTRAIVTVQTVAGTAYSNSTTETILPTAAQCQGSRTIPANFLKVGTQIRVRARGIMSFPSTGDTIAWRIRWGGTGGTQLAISTADPSSGVGTTRGWDIDVVLTVRSTGATGTVIANGTFTIRSEDATAGLIRFYTFGDNATVTFNTTTANTVDLTAAWSVASTSLTVTCTQFSVEVEA